MKLSLAELYIIRDSLNEKIERELERDTALRVLKIAELRDRVQEEIEATQKAN